ncbi:MAG: dCTP deaminase [Kofleriaceae bacterium]
MSVLSTEQIAARLVHDDPDHRLVITPILDPENQLKKGQASFDVRLGRSFSLPRPWHHSSMEDLSSTLLSIPVVEEVVLDYGQPLVLHPHQFVLARTLEVVRLPVSLMAYVVGRSSWGRRGLTVATATAVHPRFYGPITLELKNVGELPISLYTFDRVAQLVFHTVDTGTAELPSQPSQFSFGFVPNLGRPRDEATRKKIEALVKRRRDAEDEAGGATIQALAGDDE